MSENKKDIKKITLYKPHKAQIRVHKVCNDYRQGAPKFIIVSAGRRAGKTKMAMNQLAFWVLKNKNVKACWFSPRESQAFDIYRQMLMDFTKAGVVKSNRGSATGIEIVLINNSSIHFRSAEADIAIRGNEYAYLILDECAYIKENTYLDTILPTTLTLGRKILMISTPRGRTNFFCRWYENIDNNPDRIAFTFTSMDNPANSKEMIETLRRVMTKNQFAQEVEGRFVEGANPFENSDTCFMKSKFLKNLDRNQGAGQLFYMGVDIAIQGQDFTVCTVMNQNGEVVFIDRFNKLTAPQVRFRIIKNASTFKCRKILIETNNQGRGIIDEIMATEPLWKLRVVGFDTTMKSKPELIEDLISAFANNRIALPDYNENDIVRILREELDGFSATYPETGKGRIQYKAEYGHDDTVMSLALALRCKNQFANQMSTPKFYII